MKSSRTPLISLMAVIFPLAAMGQEPVQEPYFLIDGPHEVLVPAEGSAILQLPVTLTIPPPAEAEGVLGWRITMAATGGTLKAIDLEGLHVSTLFDHDGDDDTPPVPDELDLAEAGSATAEVIDGPSPQVTSTVMLHLAGRRFLAEGTHTIARITVEVSMPAHGSCDYLKLEFVGSANPEDPNASVLFTRGGPVLPTLYFHLATVRPQDTRFILSIVPAGAEPSPEEDFVLEATAPPGDFLLEAEVLLTSFHPLLGVEGAQSWAVSVVHDEPCMKIESLTLAGVSVSTIFDHDANPDTPPLDPYSLDLKNAGYRVLEKGKGLGRGEGALPDTARGLISAVVLHQTQEMTLRMNSTETLLRVVYRIPVPDVGTTECRVDFIDGLYGSGTPIKNGITWNGATDCPDLETRGMVVRLTAGDPLFMRGDANSDRELDLSDAVFVLENLFLGGPRPSCRKTADADDNGAVEITDPIYLLGFLFLGGPPPLDVRLCRADPTPDGLTCLSHPCN